MMASKLIEVLKRIIEKNDDMEVFLQEGQYYASLPLTNIVLNIDEEKSKIILKWDGD